MLDNEGGIVKRNILAICPTRERIEKCKRMLYSFNRTSTEGTNIIFCVDYNDPGLAEYVELFDAEKRRYYIYYEKETTVQMFNDVVMNQAKGYDVYHLTNDDFIYHNVGFDKVVLEAIEEHGEGVYYANDKFHGEKLCVAPFITRGLVAAVGWVEQPRLTHLCADTVWYEIAKTLGVLHYLPEIVIEHIHPETKGIEKDSISLLRNSKEAYQRDYCNYVLWWKFDREKDLDKCRTMKG